MNAISLNLPSATSCGSATRSGERNRRALSVLSAGIRLVAAWRERARQRTALGALDDRLLRDIGISPYDAGKEAEKPIWR